MLLPVAAVAFAFVISVLSDLKQNHKFNWQQISNHAIRMAMYLAAIGILEVVKVQEVAMAGMVSKLASAFALAEILSALGQIRQVLGTNPLTSALQSQNPFDVTTQQQNNKK